MRFSLLIFVLHIVYLPALHAQTPFIFQNYTTKQGLASDYVFDVFQDSKGFMWFATDKGLSRYDGREFLTFNKEHGLPKSMIFKIREAPNGTLWIIIYKVGVYRFDGGKFYPVLPNEKNQTDGFHFLNEAEDKKGILRLTTKNIYTKNTDEYTVVKNYQILPTPEKVSYTEIKTDLQEVYLSDKEKGLYSNMTVNKNYELQNFLNGKTQLFIQKGKEKILKDSIFMFNNVSACYILEEKPFRYLLGTHKGLYYKTPDTLIHLTEKQGLSNSHIQQIFEDKERNIWISTFGGGVQKIRAQYIQHFLSGLENQTIHCILPTGRQAMWVAHNAGLQKIVQNRVSPLILAENNLRTIVPKDKNSFWAGSFDNFFVLGRQGQVRQKIHYTVGTSDVADWAGKVYVGTFGTATMTWVKDTLQPVFQAHYAQTGTMTERFAHTSRGLWWFTHEYGAHRIDANQQLTHFTPKEGLLGADVQAIFEQKNGALWFGTEKGITKGNRETGKQENMGNALSPLTLYPFGEESGLVGKQAVLIFEQQASLFALTDAHLHVLASDEKRWQKLGGFLTLPDKDMKINKAIYVDSLQHIYLATNKGVVILDTRTLALPAPNLQALVLLETLALPTKRKIMPNKPFLFSSQERSIVFHFASLSFIDEGQNVLYYELETPTDKRKGKTIDMRLVFQDLSFGSYVLKVYFKNAQDQASKTQTFVFEIATPIWAQVWFWVFSAAVLVGLTVWIVRYFLKQSYQRRIRQMEVEHKIQLERQRISRDLHDNVGAQLSYILRTLDNMSSETENIRLQNLQLFTQETMRNLRESIWAIQKESITSTELFLRFKKYAGTFAEEANLPTVSFKQNLPTAHLLSPTHALHLFRILQEAFQNAIKHSQATEIQVIFEETTQGEFHITLQDNGIGFDVAVGKQKEGHYGLKNLQERAEEMGAKLWIESVVGNGTICMVRLYF